MKRVLALTLLLGVVAVAARAQAGPPAQEGDLSSPALRISYADFKKLYDAKKVLVIDTRDEASFDMGHIPGARNIPLGDVAQHIDELRREKRAIVTYCS